MIVRILNDGQWELDDASVRELNSLDDQVEQAVGADDQDQLSGVLHQLLERVRGLGQRVPDEDILDSDLILPAADSTVADVRALLNDSEEGLIPN